MTPHCITRNSRFPVAGRAEVHRGNCAGTGPRDGKGAGAGRLGARPLPTARLEQVFSK